MRYLITYHNGETPFLTNYFDPENHWNDKLDMVVYDLATNQYMEDGWRWKIIEEDHL